MSIDEALKAMSAMGAHHPVGHEVEAVIRNHIDGLHIEISEQAKELLGYMAKVADLERDAESKDRGIWISAEQAMLYEEALQSGWADKIGELMELLGSVGEVDA